MVLIRASNEYHNICFCQEIGKISLFFLLKIFALSIAMKYTYFYKFYYYNYHVTQNLEYIAQGDLS